MIVRFGNLTVDEFEKRLSTKFSEADKTWLNEHRQNRADVTDPDKFHIFDMPFAIDCGDNVTEPVTAMLVKYNDKKSFEARLAVIGNTSKVKA